MKVAIIDMGTNTFNLLIKDMSSRKFLIKTKISVRLGEGGLTTNKISPEASERAIAALKEHKTTIESWDVQETYAFATSAVRGAQNNADFVAEVKEKTGISVNVISGDKEAELIYYGVSQALKFGKKNSLIVDIGGGSTELVIANNNGVLWKKSYLLGSSRLLQQFSPADPITKNDIEKLEQHFKETLGDLFQQLTTYPIHELIGSSGSFDTLSEMIIARFNYDPIPQNTPNYTFNLKEYEIISNLMIQRNYHERLNTPGMIPMRADMIVMACVLVNYLLKKLNIQQMKLSIYALKEGVFKTLNDKTNLWLKS